MKISQISIWGAALVLAPMTPFQTSAGELGKYIEVNWHQWRGPLATGAAIHADPPINWSEQENVRWKVDVEGRGNATPIIWGDHVFVLTTIDTGRVDSRFDKPEDQPERPFGIVFPNTFHKYEVVCLDRETGRERWRQTAAEIVPPEGHHGDNSFASSSPTTDGERVYAWFGAAGCYCYDLTGELLWKRDLGPAETRRSFGEGSSPVVHDGRLIITRDQEGPSYLIVLDALTGDELWRVDRDEPSAWATPVIVSHDGTTQVVTNATNMARSYNLQDGTLLWECAGQVANVIPSPVVLEDTVYCMSGYRGSALYAISLGAQGDVSGRDAIAWSKDRGTPYVPSPLLYKDRLYFTQSNDAILSCLDARTGEQLMERTRLPGIRNLYASPVAAADRIYLLGRDGTMLVIEAGTDLHVLATNRLDDRFDASPSLAGTELFLRGKEHVYCIATP